ncbi:SQS1_6 [Sanghuangporus weigelae]
MAPGGNGRSGHARGRGRNAPPFRGRGQTNRGGGRGGGRHVYNNLNIIDVDIQRYADDSPGSGYASPAPRARGRWGNRGRSRGRGVSTPLNLQVYNNGRAPLPPRREDAYDRTAPGGRGSGRGPSRGLGARYNPNMPLSKLLALDRPYLRPINFVRAQLTPVLFEHQEELIEVHEFKEPEDHVPTAEQVSRVFSHHEARLLQDSFFQDPAAHLFEDADSEPVVTVEFGSLGKLLDGTSTSQTEPESQATVSSQQTVVKATEDIHVFDAIMQALSINANETTNTTLVTDTAPDKEQVVERISLNEESVETGDGGQGEMKNEEQPLFIIDAAPARLSVPQEGIAYTPGMEDLQPLGSQLPEDDEVIVYVAPHPRSGRATPNIPSSTDALHTKRDSIVALDAPASEIGTVLSRASSTSEYVTALTKTPVSESNEPVPEMSFSSNGISQAAQPNREQTASSRARRLTKRDRHNRAARWKGKRRSSFGVFGAMLEERHLHEDEIEANEKRVRRQGSDIDWGDGDSGSDRRHGNGDPGIDHVSSSPGGTNVDEDLDPKAMENFVRSMSNKGMEHTTFDDIRDAERLELEDEEDEGSPSGSEDFDGEVEAVLKAEEERIVDEIDSTPTSDSEGEDEDDISSDDDETPVQNFQARLEKMRLDAKAKGKMKESAFSATQASSDGLFGARMSKLPDRGKKREEESEQEDEEGDSGDFDTHFSWAERDEEYLADLQDLLDEDDGTFVSDRKQRKALFRSVLNGDFSSAPAKKKRDYGKDLPPELRAQWKKDRAKKAENKAKGDAARLEAAADPFAKHKGGKKGRKAMRRAARLAEEDRDDAPAADLALIVRQVRMYLDNLSLTVPMALPPMDKASRAKVHEIAAAFGLKSQSKGKGAARYTSIIKTSRSGINIKERKIQRILRSGGDWGFSRPGYPDGGKGGGAPKHKEGDEVGKEAPKIGEGNVGFRMLANMGWAEGEKIGVSGGLDAPITAIIKLSKLGLGATR